MDYSEKLQRVAVLGAAGKMGRGITLLTLIEMADQMLKPENKEKDFYLYAIDVSEEHLSGLRKYIRKQVLKLAEKRIVWLRKIYDYRSDLIENGEIIESYVDDVMGIFRPVKSLEAAFGAHLIFEAIKEDIGIKANLLRTINEKNENEPWFFTNTSSIPIEQLNYAAELDGNIIGLHFYNPPAVQKLIELIAARKTNPELTRFAIEFAGRIGKKIIHSNDVAGFIGNGHFMRDALFGISQAESLLKELSFAQAVYVVNKISQDFLVRPMGIFQLIDYVGIDVCQLIMKVMNPHFPGENIHSKLIDKLIKLGIQGGQHADGTQKDGFFTYDKTTIVGVFDLKKKDYVPLEELTNRTDEFIGSLPASLKSWKTVISDPKRNNTLSEFFSEIKSMDTPGSRLAIDYFNSSRRIALQLVEDEVALSSSDVNEVLMNGFYHAYGPINDFI
jgi:3-hydroxyacyl-CoA dehydrogenase